MSEPKRYGDNGEYVKYGVFEMVRAERDDYRRGFHSAFEGRQEALARIAELETELSKANKAIKAMGEAYDRLKNQPCVHDLAREFAKSMREPS